MVGVSGVLAFSVSARTREFGVRLAIGSAPRHLLMRVLGEGASIVAFGIAAGAAGGYLSAGVAASVLEHAVLPGTLPILFAAAVLAVAAVVASLIPSGPRGSRGCPAGAPVGVMDVTWGRRAWRQWTRGLSPEREGRAAG